MNQAMIYIHGKGGTAAEAAHYKSLFSNWDIVGFDYKAETPWEANIEFAEYFDVLCQEYDKIGLIANSIGAFFTMNALQDKKIEKAYFISPIVDMERLILNMMTWAGVTEAELRRKGKIETAFGETLSWEYLCYVRANPIQWHIPTHILYGEKDTMTALDTVRSLAERSGATLTVMTDGEHWFHTDEQMAFLDGWIKQC